MDNPSFFGEFPDSKTSKILYNEKNAKVFLGGTMHGGECLEDEKLRKFSSLKMI